MKRPLLTIMLTLVALLGSAGAAMATGADGGGPVRIAEKMIHDEAVKNAPESVVHVEPKTKS